MLKDGEQFDLNHYYSKGWLEYQLDDYFADRLLELVEADRYSEVDDEGVETALWDRNYSPSRNSDIPESYLEFFNELSTIPFLEWYQAVYGRFTRTNVMLHRSREAAPLGWHWDGLDATHMIAFIYLSPDKDRYPEGAEDGLLRIGHGVASSNMEYVNTDEDVMITGQFRPRHGRLVLTNNLDPRLLHSVTHKRSKDYLRYALVGQFGYKENTERSLSHYVVSNDVHIVDAVNRFRRVHGSQE